MPNCNLNDDDYMDLFLTSDGMIHDCGSFLIEYLYVNKPVMRMLNEIPVEEQYNAFTLKCLEHYYLARKEQDIEKFIQNVINGVDPLKEQRTKFVNEVLMPKGSPSQNIIDDIIDSIDNQILYRN
jgi:CDP-glycerol glycerophosphotransferase (TagB/SpsB family)